MEDSELIDYHEIIDCIVSALDAKDKYTAGHSERVSDMALMLCNLMGISKKEKENIHIAAHLHDIGKIGVPDSVLMKDGRLTEDEWVKLKKHPEIGAKILSKSSRLSELKDIVLHHHERFDGKGYPSGLKGEEIPFGARVVAVCDSIDAITSNRCYRKAHDFEFCFNEIKKNSGIMYDPKIVDVVVEFWDEIKSVMQ